MFDMLGVGVGDCHIIRTAGGRVQDGESSLLRDGCLDERGRDALTTAWSVRVEGVISYPKLGHQSNSDWAERGHARESLLRFCRFL